MEVVLHCNFVVIRRRLQIVTDHQHIHNITRKRRVCRKKRIYRSYKVVRSVNVSPAESEFRLVGGASNKLVTTVTFDKFSAAGWKKKGTEWIQTVPKPKAGAQGAAKPVGFFPDVLKDLDPKYESWAWTSSVGGGICGFEAFGFCCDNDMLGPRHLWMINKFRDIEQKQAPTNSFVQVLDYASRSFQNLNLYRQAKDGQLFFESTLVPGTPAPDPASPKFEPTFDWKNIAIYPELATRPLLVVKFEETMVGTRSKIDVDSHFVKCVDHAQVDTVVMLYKEHFFYAYPPATASYWRSLVNWKDENLKSVISASLKEVRYEITTKPLPAHMKGGKLPSQLQVAIAQAQGNVPQGLLAQITNQLQVNTVAVAQPQVQPPQQFAQPNPAQPAVNQAVTQPNNAPQIAPVAKPVPFNKPFSGVILSDRMVQFKFNYHYSPEFKQIFERDFELWNDQLPPPLLNGIDSQKNCRLHTYEHAGLRTISDYHFAELIAKTHGKIVIDIGSKWTKIFTWLEKSKKEISKMKQSRYPILEPAQFIGFRPHDETYDRTYWSQHGRTVNKLGIPQTLVKSKFSAIDADKLCMAGKEVVVLANDCEWYPGVLEELMHFQILRPDAEIYLSGMTYCHDIGVHEYPGGEGTFEIVDNGGVCGIINTPKGNDVKGGYRHNLLDFKMEPEMVCIDQSNAICCHVLKEVRSTLVKKDVCRFVTRKMILIEDGDKVQSVCLGAFRSPLPISNVCHPSDTQKLLEKKKQDIVVVRQVETVWKKKVDKGCSAWLFGRKPTVVEQKLVPIEQNMVVEVDAKALDAVNRIFSGVTINGDYDKEKYVSAVKSATMYLMKSYKDAKIERNYTQCSKLILVALKYYQQQQDIINADFGETQVQRQLLRFGDKLEKQRGCFSSICQAVSKIQHKFRYQGSNVRRENMNELTNYFKLEGGSLPNWQPDNFNVDCRLSNVELLDEINECHLDWNQRSKLNLDQLPQFVEQLEVFHPVTQEKVFDLKQLREGKIFPLDGEYYWKMFNEVCTCKKRHVVATAPQPECGDGEQMLTHTYGICPLNNFASLIGRHLFTSQSPSKLHIDQHRILMRPLMDELAQLVINYDKLHYYSWEDHLTHYPASMQSVLRQAMKETLLQRGTLRDWKKLKCFTKTGEWQQIRKSLYNEGRREGRPRQIWGPTPQMKAYPGWINRLCLKAIKSKVPGVVCGYSGKMLADKITKDRHLLTNKFGLEGTKVFVFDGSTHDSHQHTDLIKNVDTEFFQRFLPYFFEEYDVPSQLRDSISSLITDDLFYAESTFKFGRREHKIYKIEIKGTTFSGHPTRTTLGNSLRTLSYVTYMIYLRHGYEVARNVFFGKDDNIKVYVAGDDVMIAGRKDWITHMSKDIWITHAPSVTEGVHGLGQVAKEPLLMDWDFVDFLSRDGYFDGTFKICRKLDRVVNKNSNMSYNIMKVRPELRSFFAGVLAENSVKQSKLWSTGLGPIKTLDEQKIRLRKKFFSWTWLDLGFMKIPDSSMSRTRKRVARSMRKIENLEDREEIYKTYSFEGDMQVNSCDNWKQMLRQKYGVTEWQFSQIEKYALENKTFYLELLSAFEYFKQQS